MKSRLLLSLTFAALSVLTSAAFAEELTPAADRPPAAAFRLDNLAGESMSLQDFAGQVVVVSFWATWCGPCLQEIPFMNGFFEQYGSQGLTVLAVTTDGPETLSEVRNVARRGRWTLPVLLDLDGAVSAQLNPRGTQPFTIFIDRAGRVAATHEGFSSGDEVEHEATIQALLAESP